MMNFLGSKVRIPPRQAFLLRDLLRGDDDFFEELLLFIVVANRPVSYSSVECSTSSYSRFDGDEKDAKTHLRSRSPP